MQNSTESGGTGGSINAEMNNTESANLLSSSNTKPNLLTLLNNVFALVFVIIITYLCFSNGATLFSFHPVLMSIGVTAELGAATKYNLRIIFLSLLAEEEEQKSRKRKHNIWVHDIFKKRSQHGEYHTLFPDLLNDDAKFFRYFRISQAEFTTLVDILKPHLLCIDRARGVRLLIGISYDVIGTHRKSCPSEHRRRHCRQVDSCNPYDADQRTHFYDFLYKEIYDPFDAMRPLLTMRKCGRLPLYSYSILWLVVMGTAINAISTGNLATEWMPLRLKSTRHWILQVAAFTIIGMGSIVIIVNKIIHDKEHFKTLHSLFGLMTALFVTFTGLGGVGVLYRLKVAAYISPSLVKLLHIAFGVVTYAIGCITISLGLFSTWWSFGEGTRYFCLMILWIVFIMTSIKPAFNVRFMLNQRRP